MNQTPTLIWFRQDLRLRDNPALNYACKQGKVVALYILDDTHAGAAYPGAASQWWLHHSLKSLNKSLGNKLHFIKGDPLVVLPDFVAKQGIKQVLWNRCYESWQIARDKQVKQLLSKNHIETQSFNASLLWEPWQVLKKDDSPYKVFTAYYRSAKQGQMSPRMPEPGPTGKKLKLLFDNKANQGLESFHLLPKIPWHKGMEKEWTPGEQGASDRLSHFLREAIDDYQVARDVPGVRGTSRLSPHLHFGELSPQQVWYAALFSTEAHKKEAGLNSFLSELAWREFSYYLLYHFPDLPTENFKSSFNSFPWKKNTSALRAWQQGQTGIPIVDAGMRELWQSGFMHNRVRMIVASFLVKNLLIHWHEGERWFWDCLVDADLAANSASWQWVAGSGADAAPYFRIFNPVLQSQKFDAEGEYLRQYCPELAQLPSRYIHAPWEAPAQILKDANVHLGDNYPKPLVDLKASRQAALDAFKYTKELNNQELGKEY